MMRKDDGTTPLYQSQSQSTTRGRRCGNVAAAIATAALPTDLAAPL
jgi:hypothetical protein